MSCPWAKIEKSEVVQLEDIIWEEIARNLQAKKEKKYLEAVDKVNNTGADKITDDFGSECDDNLQCTEEECNGFYIDNCRRLSLNDDFESDSGKEVVDIRKGNDCDKDRLDKEFAYVSRSVFKRNRKMENAEYTISGCRNTCKLSRKVFNSLELHSYDEEFRRYKIHRDKQKRSACMLLSIDQRAWSLIREMIRNQILLRVIDKLSFSREAVTLRAVKFWPKLIRPKWCMKMRVPPPLCMIKVFRMNLKIGKARIIACRKVEKEVANYGKLKAAGVPCFDVIAQREHVLVTTCRGISLKDSYMCVMSYRYVYMKVRDTMKRYYEADLIHADLSESDILLDCYSTVYIINVSQCVERSHKDAFNYLYRSCTNIFNFF